jgi:hypothetical protein
MLYAAGSVRDLSVDADELCGLAWCDRFLWFCDGVREQAVAVDICTGAAAHTLACPGLRIGLACMDGWLLYGGGRDLRLRVVDRSTGALVTEIENPRPGSVFAAMAVGRDGLWLAYDRWLELRATDDLSLLSRIRVSEPVSGITITDRYLVYSDQVGESITIVDPVLEQAVLPISVDGHPTGLGWDGSRIWYCDMAASRLRAIDVPGIVSGAQRR